MPTRTAILLGLTFLGAAACAESPVTYLSGTPVTLGPALESPDIALVDIYPGSTVVPATWGAGVQWDAHEWFDLTPEQWQRITERVAFMRPGIIRCMVQAYWYCTGLRDGEPVYVWQNLDADRNLIRDDEGYPVDVLGHRIHHNLKRMEKLYRILDFCQRQGIAVMLGEWGAPAKTGWTFGPANHLDGPGLGLVMDDPRYAHIAAGLVEYLVKERGYTCIRSYNLGNEVNYNYPQNEWLAGMRNLYRELEARGLTSQVELVAPDAGFWQDLWLYATAEGLPREVGVWDYHWYVQPSALRDGTAGDQMRLLRNFTSVATPGRPLVLGELGLARTDDRVDSHTDIATVRYGTSMAAAFVQFSRAGLESSLAWDLDDAIHINGPVPPLYRPEADTVLKCWGFWNSLGAQMGQPEAEAPRPWYYAWSVLSRAFGAGSRVVATSDPGLPGLSTLAAATPASADSGLSLALVNDWPEPRQVLLRCRELKRPVALARFVFSDESRPVDRRGYPVAETTLADVDLVRGLSVSLPAGGLVVLTSLGAVPGLDGNDAPETLLCDDLGSLQTLAAHSANLGFNGLLRHPDRITGDLEMPLRPFWGDRTRIHRADDQPATLVWRLDDARDLRLGVFSKAPARERVRVSWSSDQQRWLNVPLRTTRPVDSGEGWQFAALSPVSPLPDGVAYVRAEILAVGDPAETQLSRMEISTAPLPTLELTRVETPALRTGVGHAPELPRAVRGWLNHEFPVLLPVAWSTAPAGAWDAVGDVSLPGTIAGTRLAAAARVLVADRLQDSLDDLSKLHSCSPGMRIDRGNAALLGGDTGRLFRTDAGPGEAVWELPGLRAFSLRAYAFNATDVAGLIGVQVSADAISWQPVPLTATETPNPEGQGWRAFELSGQAPADARARFLRVTFTAGEPSWLQQLGEVTLRQ